MKSESSRNYVVRIVTQAHVTNVMELPEKLRVNDPLAQPTHTANRSIPPSVVISVLAYPDMREAVARLCRAFGFIERLGIADHRAQLTFGERTLVK